MFFGIRKVKSFARRDKRLTTKRSSTQSIWSRLNSTKIATNKLVESVDLSTFLKFKKIRANWLCRPSVRVIRGKKNDEKSTTNYTN
jgi:hypothetical protein